MRSTTLVLTTDRRRSTYHTGTQTRRVEGFDVLVPHELLDVSPEDAVDLRLDDGDEAEITSHRGTLTVPVKITDRSPMGVVFMSFHFPDKVLTNLLTTDSHDPTTHTAEYKACAVRIRKAGMAVGA
jgi:predicted molibdopterin-dependent oxidoreductase YjgC